MARSERETRAVGDNQHESAADPLRDDRVASVEETMRVARILALRHTELLCRLA